MDWSTDPYSQVYAMLANAVDDSPWLTDAILPRGNRILFNASDPNPAKTAKATADFPQMMLLPDTVTETGNTTDRTVVMARHNFVVDTGNVRLALRCFPILWALWKTMKPLEDHLNASRIGNDQIIDVAIGTIQFEYLPTGRKEIQFLGRLPVDVTFQIPVEVVY